MRTEIFPARFDQLDEIREFIARAARDAGLDDADVYSVELCVDEACTNVIEHAYEGISNGEIECTCDSNEDALTIIIRDHGRTFDLASVAIPDLDAALDERPIGGLGVFLIKKLMDDVRFENLGESGNVLTMIKRRRQAK